MLENPKIIALVVSALILYALYICLNDTPVQTGGYGREPEGFQEDMEAAEIAAPETVPTVRQQVEDASPPKDVLPPPQMSNPASETIYPAPCNTEQMNPASLLPIEGGFSDSNPQGSATLAQMNFFTAGHHAGLNTQASVKNRNQQIRSDPLIHRKPVGPWHQSTIEADTGRKQFDIGE